MPTDADARAADAAQAGRPADAVAVFLFAHQDDEFGVYQQILAERQRGRRVVCAYFTTGVPPGGDPSRRDRESLSVLGRLGVREADVVFAGTRLAIADGNLIESIPLAYVWSRAWLTSFESVAAIYMPAWEGGHPDHDGLHAVAAELCSELGIAGRAWQFPLYNGDRCPRPFFRILSPLRANGPVTATRIPWARRIRFLKYALSYPSQRGSWVGLFPFLLLHYLVSGSQSLQAVRRERILQRPHDGLLYYEHRRFSTWDALHGRVAAWLAGRGGDAR